MIFLISLQNKSLDRKRAESEMQPRFALAGGGIIISTCSFTAIMQSNLSVLDISLLGTNSTLLYNKSVEHIW
jgi:hypothetical protein